ncbi:EPIDERMAL PATTERNING FACTOR-like protein 6 [Amborella trichopoda]|uniref:Epidermal patterning factor-like protein n=1 Tax=Amborella trichopoda TaxID=13333 RepID=U5CQ80_AMBTC|nr:EPIDERMAL PATTERNING FACTOR-like protein 6 [Amborella trichopoda]ERN15336.1 hypothetical protein AMTR_s00036p00122620 [Amborella trichopoda]|eukprot:XP_020528879.1 EPIDERMAL PATTERNING FACTOR-like protein 6 [Amborella trichopoda]
MVACKQLKGWRFPIITTMISLHILCLVSATSRPLPHDHRSQSTHDRWVSAQEDDDKNESMKNKKVFWDTRLGSRPPRCDNKCGGCRPCEAIQVPTTTDHLHLHYANYEPEGWKCKCGASFYNP